MNLNHYKKKIVVSFIIGVLTGVAGYHIYSYYSGVDLGIALFLFTGGIFFKSAIKDFFA